MGTRKPAGNPVNDSEGDQTPSSGYEVYDRAAILKKIKARSTVNDFPELVETTQQVMTELFLNQAAICLKIQTDYMARKRPLLTMDEFRILNILTDLMRETTAYDYGVDINRAWEFIERQGYKITDAATTSESEKRTVE